MVKTSTEISISSDTGLIPEFTVKVTAEGIAVVFVDDDGKPIRTWHRTYNELYERSESQAPPWV